MASETIFYVAYMVGPGLFVNIAWTGHIFLIIFNQENLNTFSMMIESYRPVPKGFKNVAGEW